MRTTAAGPSFLDDAIKRAWYDHCVEWPVPSVMLLHALPQPADVLLLARVVPTRTAG